MIIIARLASSLRCSPGQGESSRVPHLDVSSWVVRSVDALLRQCQGIEEFTDDEECVYRVSQAHANRARTLSDGVSIANGQPILQIHFWHEHLRLSPRMARTPLGQMY